jgi:glucuronate isomerase
MDESFMLTTNTAQVLYHNYAEKQKIIDYHCHINPKEIADDVTFENITQIWLGADHYKWRLMRAAGVSEEYITGNAPDYEKFLKYAQVLSYAVGNPLYHWSHLELKKYFNYSGVLSEKTAPEVWEITASKLKTGTMSAKQIIANSNVEAICTTDDPADSLEYHEKIENDKSFGVSVYPAWRPDRAINIENADFLDYIEKLSAVCSVKITGFEELCACLLNRMFFFNSKGCKTSDHGITDVPYSPAQKSEIEKIFEKRKQNAELSSDEIRKYKTAILLYLGEKYAKFGWVMQLHFGVKRNNNTAMYNKIGADTGFDCIGYYPVSNDLVNFMDALDTKGFLPKTILYSLNPTDNAYLDTVAGCFQGGIKGKIQHGSAWWFNDHKKGMYEHIENLASVGYLAGFVGMLTDSRSLLSYPRHDYFRRILCDFLGKAAESGEFPADIETLGKIAADISYNNTKEYFGFQIQKKNLDN